MKKIKIYQNNFFFAFLNTKRNLEDEIDSKYIVSTIWSGNNTNILTVLTVLLVIIVAIIIYQLRYFANKLRNTCIRVTAYTFGF